MISLSRPVTIPVRAQDYVLLTSGSMMTNASYGDNTHIAEINRDTEDMGLFTVWKNLATRNKKFGNPDKFLSHIDKTKWMSFFLTVEDYPEFFERLEKMTGSKSGTGGGITFMDSGWEMSLVIYDRDYFPDQREKNRDVLWGDGLFGERIGSYIKKPIIDCSVHTEGDTLILQPFMNRLDHRILVIAFCMQNALQIVEPVQKTESVEIPLRLQCTVIGLKSQHRVIAPPQRAIDLRVRRDHVMYDLWERQGFLQTTEGNVVHYGFIEKFIEELGTKYNIREIAFDRWGAVQMVQNLEGMGFTVIPFGQGFKDMSPPTKELMKLTLEQKLAHGGHPVLRWMMDNIFIRTDPAGNIKADKEKSTEKIDGAIATIMALDRAIRCGNDTSASVYDDRGILFI